MIIPELQQHAVDVDSLKIDPANANTHPEKNLRAIMGSLETFSQRVPLVARRESRVVIAGNGRLEAARALGWDQVACVFVDDDDITAMRYAIADNRTGELSEWDGDALSQMLQHIADDFGSLDATGFDVGDFDELIDDLEKLNHEKLDEPPEIEVDKKDEYQQKWGTELGQTWRVGVHTVICADSTTLDPPEFDALFFDPPWEIGALPVECDTVLAFSDGFRIGELIELFSPRAPTWLFTWDCVTRWFTQNRPLRGAKYCMWFGDVEQYNYKGSHYGEAGEAATITNSRGTYDYVPDPRGKHLADVFRSPITQVPKEGGLKHAKPVDWLRCLIANCTAGTIYDPFAGSGSAAVACEQLGRASISVEFDPGMCAGILERLSEMGLTPELIDEQTS